MFSNSKARSDAIRPVGENTMVVNLADSSDDTANGDSLDDNHIGSYAAAVVHQQQQTTDDNDKAMIFSGMKRPRMLQLPVVQDNQNSPLYRPGTVTVVNPTTQPQHQQSLLQRSQKRYNTRAVANNGARQPHTASLLLAPIRVHPPTYNLHFRRLHDLFFRSENLNDNGQPSEESTLAATIPPTIKIGRLRLRSIYEFPNIFVINQFLSSSDIQHFFKHIVSKYKFQPSYVDDDNTEVSSSHDTEVFSGADGNERSSTKTSCKNPYRTSTFIALNKQHDARIASIEQKVASLFGCSSKQIEAIQVVRYQSPNQFFHIHHDLGIYNETTGHVQLPNKSIWYRRRMTTLFCYLNTIPPNCGGATYFPYCRVHGDSERKHHLPAVATTLYNQFDGPENQNSNIDEASNIDNDLDDGDETIVCNEDGLRIHPVAGRAILFSNVLSSGFPDPRTIHAGEPVLAANHKRNQNLKNEASSTTTTNMSSTNNCNSDNAAIKYGLNIWICEG